MSDRDFGRGLLGLRRSRVDVVVRRRVVSTGALLRGLLRLGIARVVPGWRHLARLMRGVARLRKPPRRFLVISSCHSPILP